MNSSMSIFSPLVICVVYICIISLSASISQARNLRSIGYGVVNNEDSQDHTTFQNPSKSPEKTKIEMTIMPSGTNASTMIAREEGRMKMKSEEKKMDGKNQKRQVDDDHHNDHQELFINGKKIKARSHHEIEGKIPPSSNPKGKSSRRLAKRKRKLPQATVSWRVPRKKKNNKGVPQQQQQQQQQRQAFFDLDYAPPRVHPPTHN